MELKYSELSKREEEELRKMKETVYEKEGQIK